MPITLNAGYCRFVFTLPALYRIGEVEDVQPVGYCVVTLATGIVVFVVIMAITTLSATYGGGDYSGG